MNTLTLVTATVWKAVLWLWTLAKAHPAITAPIVGMLVTAALKPRTGAQYLALASRNPTWLFTRYAAMLQLIGAIFPDSVKARQVLLKVILGQQEAEKLPPQTPLSDAQASRQKPS